MVRKGRDMRVPFIARHRHVWPVAWMGDALEVSRSGFQAWLNSKDDGGRAVIADGILDRDP